MPLPVWIKSSLWWMALVFIAILNGGFRESFISPYLGEYSGHLISTFSFIFLLFLSTLLFIKRVVINGTDSLYLKIGLYWVCLTIVFEFLFGHFIMGHSWHHLLADYNLLNGRVWIIVLIAILFMPFVVHKIVEKGT